MADYVEITLEQGATYSSTVTVNDSAGVALNLVSYTAAAQMRKSYYSTTAHDFTVTITSATSGIITIDMSAANTAALAPGRYVYDVNLTSAANVVSRIFEGTVAVTPGVTR